MNRLKKYGVTLLLLPGGWLVSGPAVAYCTTDKPYTVQVSLKTPTLSAGAEFPTGSVIMLQRVSGLNDVSLTCYYGNPTPVFNLTGGNLYPGQTNVYQTGISGLGVRFRQVYDKRYYPYTGTAAPPGSTLYFQQGGYLAFDIEFVKLGSITAGTVNTSFFPQIQVNGIDTNQQAVRVAWHTITGSATIQASSCTTPNFNWDLGTTNTTVLQNQGDASAWVDTPVKLTGCSAFLGNNINGSYTQYSITGNTTGNITQPGNLASNQLTMTLTPNTSVIDSTNGIVSLDGAATASGFGVQVASKQSGTYAPQNLAGSMVVSPVVGDSSGTVSFPLGARIIRTSNTVQGGKISTSLTYTINYQ